MDKHLKRLNRSMVIGWLLISVVLAITYGIEVLKGTRTPLYLLTFVVITALPSLIALAVYLKKPDVSWLCYYVVFGYSILYIFVLLTGRNVLVSMYILPILSLLVPYHKPKLVLGMGIAALIAVALTIPRFYDPTYNDGKGNTDVLEMEVGVILLSFVASFFAARIYNDITKQNQRYLEKLNEQNEKIQNMTVQTITTVANALDAKDSYSEGHSRRVAVYAAQIAEKLGFSKEDVRNVRIIALLHDIGKIGVPDSVLNKPGRLTDEEFELMKQHSVIGSEILKDIDMITGISIGARSHHERYDGKGYPEGLKGEDIPYIARIIAVADSYDAMTSNRVYRKHLTYEQVMSELEKGEGTQFDPDIAKAMEALIKDGVIANISPDMEIKGA
ncbi:MAG: HD-GYP domain-containing protein [Oscillospiraceae bacterium]|nr:HD-GYP domain-containing protein [Oscillospiraceae bacterium]